jgi:hypothetical protein
LSHRNDRGVHANYASTRIHKGPTRITWVQRRRVLNNSLNESTLPAPQGAAQRADNAGGHSGLEAERVAYRDDKLSYS